MGFSLCRGGDGRKLDSSVLGQRRLGFVRVEGEYDKGNRLGFFLGLAGWLKFGLNDLGLGP